MVDLLPPNASALERRLDATMEESTSLPVNISSVWDPATCPIESLPHLAWANSVDFWADEWPEEDKREVVAQSLQVHRHKGTPGAIKDAIRAAGYGDVEIIEGLDIKAHDGTYVHDGVRRYGGGGHWAWFIVTAKFPVSIAQAAKIKEIVLRTQREVCFLHSLRYDEALNLHNAAVAYDGTFTHGVVDGQSA